MKTEEYDEAKVLDESLTRNFSMLMTDRERRAYDLALRREKAKYSDVAADRLPRWIAKVEPDVRVCRSKGRRLSHRRPVGEFNVMGGVGKSSSNAAQIVHGS